ncbi:MAG: class I SAM-dependent methyltransferase [Mucilaginibacter sp.]
MSFSSEWESIYQANQQMSIWPWSDLISYVMRYSKPTNEKFKVLELGCGAGANILFFQHLNVDYYATEGSESVVDYLINKHPSLSEKIKVADFTKEIPFDMDFDLIFDRAAIAHNSTSAIKSCIDLISRHLKHNGLFIGIDWFSTSHTAFNSGTFTTDSNTKNNYPPGHFHQVGQVHFSDRLHIEELFEAFELIKLEHKTVVEECPKTDYQLAWWNFVVKKIK